MKWSPTSYVRVSKQGDTFFVLLVTERFLRKDLFLLLQTDDRQEARQLALQEAAQRQISCRLED